MLAANRRPRCVAITGPTACGKTELALELAEVFPIEIISMDSAMVYRGMNIGTAKPSSDIRDRIPHHLVDIRDPEDSYSAGKFAGDAATLVAEISARGCLPLIVGGTMLYLRALREGIASLPERSPTVRATIDAEAAACGWPALHDKLTAIDPVAAAGIGPNDRQRIQRALEVHAITGRTLTELRLKTPGGAVEVDCVAVIPEDRSALGERIERRFSAMLEQGFVDEVRRLHERPGLSADSQSMRSVGYRQLWSWLDGRSGFDEAVGRAVVATRQLAKRQLTWLKGDRLSHPVPADDPAIGAELRDRLLRLADSA